MRNSRNRVRVYLLEKLSCSTLIKFHTKGKFIMIYELYGVPGAGKTALINKVKGKDTISFKGALGIKDKLFSLLKIFVAYIPSSIAYKVAIKKIIGNRNLKAHYISSTVAHNINNIVMVAFGYKYLKGNLYMDEGIIHRIMTFAINYDINIEDTLRLVDVFSDCMCNVKSFYLKEPVALCFQSIKQRNRHESEMDEMEDEKLIIFLNEYEQYSEAIEKRYGHLIITRENFKDLIK